MLIEWKMYYREFHSENYSHKFQICSWEYSCELYF